jgi:hypothetical protein
VTRLNFKRKKKEGKKTIKFYCKNVNLLSFLACMKGVFIFYLCNLKERKKGKNKNQLYFATTLVDSFLFWFFYCL